jgi:hypothetical protein
VDIGARNINDSIARSSKEEKIRALDHLDQKSVFRISRTGATRREQFQVSEFILFGSLEEIQSQRNVGHGEAAKRSAENESTPLRATRW